VADVSCRRIRRLTPGKEAQTETSLYVSCTSAKFVIDTIKPDLVGHYADQEIRVPRNEVGDEAKDG